jgi:hypothetical protein
MSVSPYRAAPDAPDTESVPGSAQFKAVAAGGGRRTPGGDHGPHSPTFLCNFSAVIASVYCELTFIEP